MSARHFSGIPCGSVLPLGWYRCLLDLQNHHNTGRIDSVWPDLGEDSGWLGGSGEHWERGPYYLDGLVPLAVLEEDPLLVSKARKWVDCIISSQRPDGDFGPAECSDIWPKMVAVKAIWQAWEAWKDERIPEFLHSFIMYLDSYIGDERMTGWAYARGYELILFLYWYCSSDICSFSEEWIISLGKRIRRATFPWTAAFNAFRFKDPVWFYHEWQLDCSDPVGRIDEDWFIETHAVNVSMALKCFVLDDWLDGTHLKGERLCKALAELEGFHGSGDGIWTGSEHLAGASPSQGVELCSIVEMLFSLEQSMTDFPEDSWIADHIEKVAFNALPVSFSYDMSVHQYLHQANQISATIARRKWYNNGDDSNIFGLEPNFGCCTANLHQGFPKLASSAWFASGNEIHSGIYIPCRTTIPTAEGNEIMIEEDGGYPFSESIRLGIEATKPAFLGLRLRIPGWCRAAACTVNGHRIEQENGCFCIDKVWQTGDRIELRFPFELHQHVLSCGGMSIYAGPLQLCLPLEENWNPLCVHGSFQDYEVTTDSVWDYAIRSLDGSAVTFEKGSAAYPKLEYPVVEAALSRCLNWHEEMNSAGEIPLDPVLAEETRKAVLKPYCLFRLHISVFPYRRAKEI